MSFHCRHLFLRRILRHSLRRYAIPAYSKNVKVLGIETSCDDTGCAVVDGAGNLLGESLFSQNAVHVRYGGVNPVFAHELHRDNIEEAVSQALGKAKVTADDIDAVAVTTKPGLLVSLQVGVKYARFLARKHQKPLIPIHHMEAHALVTRMYNDIQFPFLVLLISGGDALLAVARNVTDFLLLGQSLDNAPGEIMDKAARRLKLRNMSAYSEMAGGKAIEMAAANAKNPDQFQFTTPLVRNRNCDFSFSGLKESLLKHLKQKETEHEIMGDILIPEVNDLCAAFQSAIAEHIVHRTERAMLFCEKKNLIPENCRNLVVSGGVACNNFIFKTLEGLGSKVGYKVLRPPGKVCTDNGVMIAWNGIEKLRIQQDVVTNIDLKDIQPVASLGTSIIDEVKSANLQTRVTRLKKLYAS